MGLNIDKTYRLVQFVANKEHRGWLSPEEFNLAAEIAQLSLYSEKEAVFAGSKKILADMLPFVKKESKTPATGKAIYPTDIRHFINAYIESSFKRLAELTQAELADAMDSEIITPSTEYPACVQRDDGLYVYPVAFVAPVVIEYLAKPTTPEWAYTVVSNRPVYAVGSSTDFDFDEILFLEISSRILEHVGINLKDTELSQYMQLHQQKEAN